MLTVLPATQDDHPPLSYLVFHGLRQLGLTDAGMRLCSLAMTALALMLVQILVLSWIAERERAAVSPQTRLIAVLMFGLIPIAVSQGDALRWYPLFALQIALFVTLYLAPQRDAIRLWSGAALGLAGSTNFLALLMVPALMFAPICVPAAISLVIRFDLLAIDRRHGGARFLHRLLGAGASSR